MKLQQLRYIWEVAHHDLNVSATAQSLYTSQPGISKQIRLLEDELGVEVFSRSGKHLTQVTPAGEKILHVAGEVLQLVEGIKQLAQEFNEPDRGTLCIAVTHTQARYLLPEVVSQFTQQFPAVSLQLQQGTPQRVAELVADGNVDIAIATNGLDHNSDLTLLPCYRWTQAVIVPKEHPLASLGKLSLEGLAEYPLITYAAGYAGHAALEAAFQAKGMTPRLAATATDSEVIKAYVRAGLGVGVVATMACEPDRDGDLLVLPASHLFEPSITWLGLWKGAYLRGFTYDFIARVAPHVDKALIDKALATHTRDEREKLYQSIKLPLY